MEKYLLENFKRKKYIDVLEKLADENFAKIVARTETLDDAYREAGKFEEVGLWDQDENSIWGLEARGVVHSKEAFDLIRALLNSDKDQQEFDLVVTKRVLINELNEEEFREVHMSRAEIIERLEWISSLKFGDDLEAWREWMEIRLEEGFMLTR